MQKVNAAEPMGIQIGRRPTKDVAISSDGVPLRYEVRGAGSPALVFVHGWSCDRSYWKAQLELFAREHRVVALDLAGHGQSGLGRKTWTMPAFGEDVMAVVEKLGLKETVLIGHSMGGYGILEAARLMPQRVRGLVCVDAYNTLGRPRGRDEVEEFMAPFRADFVATTRKFVSQMFIPSSDKALVDWVVADMSAAPPEVALSALESGRIFDRDPTGLRDLKAPIVAINSDLWPTDVEALRSYGVKVMIMPGVGHFLMMENPATFNRLLREAIKGFVGSTP